jgi:hyaluronan synthase
MIPKPSASRIDAALDWLADRDRDSDKKAQLELAVPGPDSPDRRRRLAEIGWERSRREARVPSRRHLRARRRGSRTVSETARREPWLPPIELDPALLSAPTEALGPTWWPCPLDFEEPPLEDEARDDRAERDRAATVRRAVARASVAVRQAAAFSRSAAESLARAAKTGAGHASLQLAARVERLRDACSAAAASVPSVSLPSLPRLDPLPLLRRRAHALRRSGQAAAARLRSVELPSWDELLPQPSLEEALARWWESIRGDLPRRLAVAAARACALLVFAVCMTNIFFLRFENFGNFWYRPLLNAYSIGVAGFILSRFAIALFYRPPRDRGIEPSVSVIITAFNEEEAILRSIASCYAVEYPRHKLEVVVVDDGSTDRTPDVLERAQDRWPKLVVVRFDRNEGKREAMAAGARIASGDILLYVDSDSFLRADAVRKIVQGFADPSVAAVAGHTDVANANVNLLTRMQEVRYYVAFRVLKAAESVFGAVTCCPGCFSAYRRSCVSAVLGRWLDQRFLGVRATFGDDRALTNMLLRRYRVIYTSEAVATTIVPESHAKFLRQQLRWKKSWLRECLIAARFMWKKHPLAAIGFYAQLVFPVVAPLVLLRAFVWIPLVQGDLASVLLYTYGVMLIGLIFSSYYLFWRVQRGWVCGVYFTLYYMFVLVWQMPYAIATSRDNRWGTR